MVKIFVITGLSFIFLTSTFTQQKASKVEPPRTVDLSFDYQVKKPAYKNGEGPFVIIDEVHNNFHTSVTTYIPFALTLTKDGYRIKRGTKTITRKILDACDIYVISDAQPPKEEGDPPTFLKEEIAIFNLWVKDGGSLFIITDHMPDPSAIKGLAQSFGIEVNDGYVLNGSYKDKQGPFIFNTVKRNLIQNFITRGRQSDEQVSQIATFTGSAFKAGKEFIPVLVFNKGKISWMPKEFYKFKPETPNIDVSGWFQGGVMKYGKGKLAFFSEAAMFTAQVFQNGKVKVGMNSPVSRDNKQLLLNVMHWLSGILSD